MSRPLLLLSVALLAGCVTESAVLAPVGEASGAWAFDCEGRSEVAPGVCAGSASRPTSWLGEPAIGLQPNGTRAFLAAMSSAVDTVAATRHVTHVLGFVSDDAGATWENVGVVPAPAGGIDHIDPSLVVDEQGVVHYTGLRETGGAPALVFYTRSADGRTWSDPLVLSGDTTGTIDRNWITRGPSGALYVSWQEFIGVSRVVVSVDDGESWEPVEGVPGCDRASRVIERGLEAWFTCQGDGTKVVAFDRATLGAAERGAVDASCSRGNIVDVGRALQLVCETLLRYESVDEGVTWRELEPLDLEGVDGWTGAVLSAVAGDARGVHLLVREPPAGEGVVPFGINGLAPIPVSRVAHILTDEHGTTLATTELTIDGAQQRRTDAGAGAWSKDDFHDISLAPQGALLAWARGGGVDVALQAWTTA